MNTYGTGTYGIDVWTSRAALPDVIEGEPGAFEGLAASFDSTAYGPKGPSRFATSAFDRTVRNRPEVPLLWSHRDDEVIGLARLRVDPTQGLMAKAKLALGVPKADEAHALLKMGAVNGLSIGFTPKPGSLSERNIAGEKVRLVGEADVLEVSLVVFPADATARVKWTHASWLEWYLDPKAQARREYNAIIDLQKQAAQRQDDGAW
jgi:hypothetical protein